MRTYIVFAFVLGVLTAGCGGGSDTTSRQEAIPDNAFAMLDAYGTWVDLPGVGHAWQPNVAYDWRPYVDGRWVWTDQGWFWDSAEPYAWVVYHYGTWDTWGSRWVWIPGYIWAPAQVRWEVRDDYIGWAPMPPPGMTRQNPYDPGSSESWIFVPADQFTREHIGSYRSTTIFTPPGTGQQKGSQNPPDLNVIARRTREPVPKATTKRENVRRGSHTLIRAEAVPPPRPIPNAVDQPSPPPPPREGNQKPVTPPSHSGVTPTPAKEPALKKQEQPKHSPPPEKNQQTGKKSPPKEKTQDKPKEKKPEQENIPKKDGT
jgi:hypothetical protein